MLLFSISASAGGTQILSGEKLELTNVIRALNVIRDYEKTVPVSINITSKVYKDVLTEPLNQCNALCYPDFAAGRRRTRPYALMDFDLLRSEGFTEPDF